MLINDGEVTQYYVRDHHEAIISHELFDAAQELIVHNGAMYGNARGSDKYQRRYKIRLQHCCNVGALAVPMKIPLYDLP